MTSTTDWMRRFQIEHAGVRGVIARVDSSWREVRARASYPPTVASLLGESLAASALFAGNITFAGSIAIQLKSTGPVRLVFAECTSGGELRGIAHWEGELAAGLGPADLGRDAVLAITIEHAENAQRHQGMVPLVGEHLSDAFEHYFAQSEQLPTAIRLAVGEEHCAGILVQQIAVGGGPGERAATPDFERIALLFRTLSDTELATLAPEVLLQRLFIEDDVRLHGPHALRFGCRCSRERVAIVLQGLGRDETLAAVTAEGVVEVRCEFCNRSYRFDPVELEQLFAAERVVPGPTTPQ